MIKRYRKKPLEIEAIRWTGNNSSSVKQFLNNKGYMSFDDFIIPTLEGPMTCSVGDYIIKGIKGEFYPCKSDIFEASYDEVGD